MAHKVSSHTDSVLQLAAYRVFKVLRCPLEASRTIGYFLRVNNGPGDVHPCISPPVQKFFSVPDHTPLYIAEAGDCGCTLVRIHCQDAVGQHESRLLEQHTPHWILDYVEKVRCVGQVCR